VTIVRRDIPRPCETPWFASPRFRPYVRIGRWQGWRCPIDGANALWRAQPRLPLPCPSCRQRAFRLHAREWRSPPRPIGARSVTGTPGLPHGRHREAGTLPPDRAPKPASSASRPLWIPVHVESRSFHIGSAGRVSHGDGFGRRRAAAHRAASATAMSGSSMRPSATFLSACTPEFPIA